jgi:hypothetical protein
MARVLLECGNALVTLDRVEGLRAAGHEVTTCSGPSHHDCPVLAGRSCDAIDDADVVVSCLGDKTLRVVLASRLQHPDRPIIAVLADSEVEGDAPLVDGVMIVPPGVDDLALAATVQRCLDERSAP